MNPVLTPSHRHHVSNDQLKLILSNHRILILAQTTQFLKAKSHRQNQDTNLINPLPIHTRQLRLSAAPEAPLSLQFNKTFRSC